MFCCAISSIHWHMPSVVHMGRTCGACGMHMCCTFNASHGCIHRPAWLLDSIACSSCNATDLSTCVSASSGSEELHANLLASQSL